MSIDPWIIWIVIGVICIIIEMFTPTFFFMSLGIGAVIAGIFSFITDGAAVQIVIFIIITFLSFISLSRVSKKLFKTIKEETNIFSVVGSTGVVVKAIQPNSKGHVKIRGEEWSAESEENQSIELDSVVTVTAVSGNKVIVKKNPLPTD